MNILLLGDNGAGKTTFINAVANYLKYDSLDEAVENGVEVLIRTVFHHMDNGHNVIRIECQPTVPTVDNGAENGNDDESPKAYEIEWGPAGDRKMIRLIHTPSFGDTRGMLHDQRNADNILSFISNYSEIHAVLVFFNATDNRLRASYQYIFRCLLPRLHPTAAQNLLFCITKTRQTFYQPGDVLQVLKRNSEELGQIPINQWVTPTIRKTATLPRDTVFCFDNEAFRYLCVRKQGINFDARQIEDIKISWTISTKETFRLLEKIGELRPFGIGIGQSNGTSH